MKHSKKKKKSSAAKHPLKIFGYPWHEQLWVDKHFTAASQESFHHKRQSKCISVTSLEYKSLAGSSKSPLPHVTPVGRVTSRCGTTQATGSSVQFSCSVVSDSLWPHEPQHTRPPCPSPTPGVYPNSCPLCQWCHPTISSSVVPFSSCPQSFPALGSSQMRELIWKGGPKYWSFSFNISPFNEHPGLISFRMDWLDLLAVQGTRKSLLQHHSSKASILLCSAFFIVQLSHTYMTIGKTIALTRQTFVDSSPTAYFNYCFHSSQTSDATSLDTTCELKLHCPVLWHQFRPIWLWCVFLFMALEFFFLSSLMHCQLYI